MRKISATMSSIPLLIVFGTLLSISTLCTSQTYKLFQEKHIVNPGPIDCNSTIRNRGIKGPGGKCKSINTFMHKARPFTGDYFCDGDCSNHSLTCPHNFDLTICTLKKGKRPPNCIYSQSTMSNSQVCLACKKNVPVHFAHAGHC
ncbi:oocytes ribonuclease-like [Pelobates fuscus]|uniref:oocytes ribonuclease-like n=1 Tax=Pelobates fuscus TaxID=191477 RepID=UPI002FE46CFA